ncbi:hypothetical protein AVEN_261446-1 [Araneus ventricosus]|uniref:Uncharacterized protein n=1 Tax=Araneus ventricosus TaxID=182803 RepID=A0A4Y2QKK6_ARAVE|nr:hypothetical protein AVEN_3542-1 [Araneus ventricosus]GBN63739.1 hypothetical protein AVEN_261446-1 [Araneus ventricosus]
MMKMTSHSNIPHQQENAWPTTLDLMCSSLTYMAIFNGIGFRNQNSAASKLKPYHEAIVTPKQTKLRIRNLIEIYHNQYCQVSTSLPKVAL